MIKILVDSCGNFSKQIKNKANVVRIPLTLELSGRVYLDSIDLNLNEFIEDVREIGSQRKTAAPSPQLFVDCCNCDEAVFIVTLSAGISGSYNSAAAAAKICEDEYGKNNIYVIDSLSAATGQTLICEELLRLDALGETPESIYEKILKYRDGLNTYFILKNYTFFTSSGRLNPYVARLARTLNIVPVCGAVDGHAALLSQARGDKGALKKLIALIKKSGVDCSHRRLLVTHIDCIERAEEVRSTLCTELGFAQSEIVDATGLCVVYADIDGIIVSF